MMPGFEGAPDMSAILAQAAQMQQALVEAQEQIAQAEVTGEAGGGLVRATVKGSGELIALVIDPKVVDPDDVETLQDLVIGAVSAALENAQQVIAEKLGPFAGALGGSGMPGLPGF